MKKNFEGKYFFLNLVKKEMSKIMNLNPWDIAGAVVLAAGLYYIMTGETKIEKLKKSRLFAN